MSDVGVEEWECDGGLWVEFVDLRWVRGEWERV